MNEAKTHIVWNDVLFGVGLLVALFFLVAGCTVWTQGIEKNDRDRIQRDQVVKVACINQGKILVNGNCIPAVS